jgi:hypothetical protein
MPQIKPYRLHRTWHLAKILDLLQAKGELMWKYSYDDESSRALFTITAPDGQSKTLQTQQAEGLAQKLANKLKIVWIPVPHYGGKENWEKTVAEIKAMKKGDVPKPWE